MIISEKYKFVFLHIPKSAGSSVREMLIDADKDCIHYLPIQHIKNDNLNEKLDGFFKFCFIRNPWERMVSMFFYAIKEKEYLKDLKLKIESSKIEYQKKIFCEWMFENVFRSGICKSDFPFVSNTSEKTYNLNRESQMTWVYDINGNVGVDFIGNVSNIDEDWRKICDSIGLEYSKLKRINTTKHRDYSEYYNEKSFNFVHEYFNDDIRYFDYRFPGNVFKPNNITYQYKKRR